MTLSVINVSFVWFVIARSFNKVLLDYPLIKLLSYLYNNASVIPSMYIFIGILNMLHYILSYMFR